MEKLPIKALRACSNLSQKEVSDKLGINRNTYAKWEKYESYPDAVQLIELSHIFGCTLDNFYFPVDAR